MLRIWGSHNIDIWHATHRPDAETQKGVNRFLVELAEDPRCKPCHPVPNQYLPVVTAEVPDLPVSVWIEWCTIEVLPPPVGGITIFYVGPWRYANPPPGTS